MVWIRVTTSPIFCAPSASERAVSPLRRALSTARAAISVDCATWRPISATEDVNSSVALATICTLAEVCSEAAATTPACRLVADAVEDIDWAVSSITEDADDSPPTSSETLVSNARVSSSSARARRILTSLSASFSTARRSALIMLSLKTCTAAAIAPISSSRSLPEMLSETSPLARRDIVAVRSTIGLQTRRRTIITSPTLAPATAASPASAIRKLKRASE
jgi:hypothetical protein